MNAGAKPQIFINARTLRKRLTAPERKLWEHILTNPFGARFRRQHPFGHYILDFYCHSKRLSIEIDGPNHSELQQLSEDVIRTSFIESMGVREIRFRNNEVIEFFEMVCKRIQTEINKRGDVKFTSDTFGIGE